MSDKILKGIFKLEISTNIENTPENDIETLRFLVEQNLQDLGYEVEIEILE